MPEDALRFNFKGTAGQSSGRSATKELTMKLEDGNDYFGKGLSGGKLVVHPDRSSTFKANENSIIGNSIVRCNQRKSFHQRNGRTAFLRKNSGATAVVEGVGAHGLRIYDRRNCGSFGWSW